jgi:hypothetical protein
MICEKLHVPYDVLFTIMSVWSSWEDYII